MMMQAGADNHPAYVSAFAMALIYNLAAYVVVIALTLLLTSERKPAAPVAAKQNAPHIA
nr:hypothetical protein [Marinicella sp. W31]MDC2876468.1 hypothetical protein [Marinicella sp. W31]